MIVLLGVVWLLDNEEYRAKLVKETLKRASQEEKQQYTLILQRKAEISQRIQQITPEQEVLNERDRQNILPEKPSEPDKSPDKTRRLLNGNRQAKETSDYIAYWKRYREALGVYRDKNAVILAQRVKLIQELLVLKVELDRLEESEKWLLLSMAIRNQSSLLGFMQVKEGSDEEFE